MVENKLGYSSKLSKVKRRLELLGYSTHNLKDIYQKHLDDYPDYYPDIDLTFDDLLSIFSSISIKNYKNSFEEGDYSLGNIRMKKFLTTNYLLH